MIFKKDMRDKLWGKLEVEIQRRGGAKQKWFVLSGVWKRFIREQDGFKVYAVDGAWVRNNLSVIFGHGGHGLVHEFIPLNEIWTATYHFHESRFSWCGCKVRKHNQKGSKAYFDSTVLHEIAEFKEMKKGLKYWKAHQLANEAEIKAAFLKDPYDDR